MADPNQQGADLRPALDPLLAQAKQVNQALKYVKAAMKFPDPLLDWELQSTELAVGHIRYGLDFGGPWEQYSAQVEQNLNAAIKVWRQVLDLL